jgi:hypothetical protein
MLLRLQELLRHYSSAGLPDTPVARQPVRGARATSPSDGNSLFAALSKATQATSQLAILDL